LPLYWKAIEDALPYEDLLDPKVWGNQIRMAAATVDMTARPTEKRKRAPENRAAPAEGVATAAGRSNEVDTNFRAYRLVAIGVEPKQTLRTNFASSPAQSLSIKWEAGCMRTMRTISIRLPTGLAATIKARLDTFNINEPLLPGGPFFARKKYKSPGGGVDTSSSSAKGARQSREAGTSAGSKLEAKPGNRPCFTRFT
jgi:hypothetical protein